MPRHESRNTTGRRYIIISAKKSSEQHCGGVTSAEKKEKGGGTLKRGRENSTRGQEREPFLPVRVSTKQDVSQISIL